MKFLTNTILSLSIACAAVSAADLDELMVSVKTARSAAPRDPTPCARPKDPTEATQNELFLAYVAVSTNYEFYKNTIDPLEKAKHLKALAVSFSALWLANHRTYYSGKSDLDTFTKAMEIVTSAQSVFASLETGYRFGIINVWSALEEAVKEETTPQELYSSLPKDIGELDSFVDSMWSKIADRSDVTRKNLEDAVVWFSRLGLARVFREDPSESKE